MPDNTRKLTIGILCSGNTCRSPVLSAWIKHIVKDDSTLTIWTAGMNMNDEEVNLAVFDDALIAANEMEMRGDLILELKKHRSRKVEFITEPANLIIWITEFEKFKAKKENSEDLRIDFIKKILLKKQADLIIIPEKDVAWEIRNNKNSNDQEIREAYKVQSEKLKQWAEIICKTTIDK